MSAPALRVRQGRWSFELRSDEVADIRYDETPLLRAVRPVLRDHDWNTVPAVVLQQRTTATPERWDAEISLRFTREGIGYRGDLAVSVTGHELAIRFAGTADTAFRRNRIGLVVLHPATEAGHEVVRVGPDGSTEQSRWPVQISPHQPFRAVHGFRWQREGVTAELALDGDTFETEDQRNWTDASFKTYSTPLELPFPVEVRPGDQVAQAVRLTAHLGRRPWLRSASPQLEPVVVTPVVTGAVPAICTEMGGERPGDALAGQLSHALEALVVELTGSPASWPGRLQRAAQDAMAIGAGLDLRFVTSDREALAVALAHDVVPTAVRLAVFDPVVHVTTPDLWATLTTTARTVGFAGTLIAGARSHFTELNRCVHQLPQDATSLTFSLTPQMHAVEVPHIVDSLDGQRSVVRSARALAEGRPLHLGPVTLRPRFNAVATSPDVEPASPDPLQQTPFTAAWTLGSLAALTGPGVASLCYYELSGPRGLLDERGRLSPAGQLLGFLARRHGRPVLHTDAPAGITAYTVAGDGGAVLLANLTGRPRTVRLHDLRPSRPGDPGRSGALSTPLVLDPWSAHRAGPDLDHLEHFDQEGTDG